MKTLMARETRFSRQPHQFFFFMWVSHDTGCQIVWSLHSRRSALVIHTHLALSVFTGCRHPGARTTSAVGIAALRAQQPCQCQVPSTVLGSSHVLYTWDPLGEALPSTGPCQGLSLFSQSAGITIQCCWGSSHRVDLLQEPLTTWDSDLLRFINRCYHTWCSLYQPLFSFLYVTLCYLGLKTLEDLSVPELASP